MLKSKNDNYNLFFKVLNFNNRSKQFKVIDYNTNQNMNKKNNKNSFNQNQSFNNINSNQPYNMGVFNGNKNVN